jgi:RNA polymerase sigma factor (sigma-70 family)
LIRQILAGRQDRFADLFRPHMTALWRVVRTKMQDSFEIEDVVQQTLLKAFTRLQQFRFEASFRTWLIRIACNEVLQWHRNRLRFALPFFEQDGISERQIADDSVSPFKICERNETVRWFYKAFVKLPQIYQAVIQQRDLEHRSISETAQFLRLTVPAVKTRHRRALGFSCYASSPLPPRRSPTSGSDLIPE